MDLQQAGVYSGVFVYGESGNPCEGGHQSVARLWLFNGAVTYSVDSLKNPRKAKLSYKIDMANPYYLDSVMYLKYPPRADSLIRAAYDQRVLHKGDNFSVLKLEEERQRQVPFSVTMVIIISVPNSLLSVRIPCANREWSVCRLSRKPECLPMRKDLII